MKDKFNKFVKEQTESLKILYDNAFLTPLLMVLYATIDVFGYMTGKGFGGFVEKYMIQNLENVTATDLWGGRCAILHTNTPNSDKSQKGEARQIMYSWGKADMNNLNKIIQESGESHKYVAVRIETICNSLILGINKLKKDIERSEKLRSICELRVKEFYCNTKTE